MTNESLHSGSDGGGVLARIQRAMDSMGPAERRVGRELIGNYPSAGLRSVVKLAADAGVSAPSVIRFARRLGYSGFPQFQAGLREELEINGASPTALYTRYRDHEVYTGETGVLASYSASIADNLGAMQRAITEAQIARCAQLLSNDGATVWIRGGRWSRSLAILLAFQLNYVRDRVRLIDETLGDPADVAIDIRADDVLVMFDFRRYDDANVRLARGARNRRVRLVLVTDEWMSPIADFAHVVLPVPIETPSPLDSLVSPLALIETILVGVVKERGDAVRTRMTAVDEARAALLEPEEEP